jgi:hypothetical protein
MKSFNKIAAAAATIALPILASAQTAPTTTAPDLTSLTGAVNLSSVSTAVLAIAGTLATVYVAIRGAKIVLSMIRGA